MKRLDPLNVLPQPYWLQTHTRPQLGGGGVRLWGPLCWVALARAGGTMVTPDWLGRIWAHPRDSPQALGPLCLSWETSVPLDMGISWLREAAAGFLESKGLRWSEGLVLTQPWRWQPISSSVFCLKWIPRPNLHPGGRITGVTWEVARQRSRLGLKRAPWRQWDLLGGAGGGGCSSKT